MLVLTPFGMPFAVCRQASGVVADTVVVRPAWVHACVDLHTRVPCVPWRLFHHPLAPPPLWVFTHPRRVGLARESLFAPSRGLFRGVVVTTAGIAMADRTSLKALVVAHGGEYAAARTPACTHVLAAPDAAASPRAVQGRRHGLPVVHPDWSVRAGAEPKIGSPWRLNPGFSL